MNRFPLLAASALLLCLLPVPSAGQAASGTLPAAPPMGSIAGRPDWPAAKPADVASPESIVAAVYDVISGPKGQDRDWDRMRSLFIPDARLIPIRALPGESPHADVTVLTIDGYIARARGRMTGEGFFERSIANRTENYGNMISVWSTYESRHNQSDATPFARGINSFQLLKDGGRFWVVNVLWDAEAPGKPIPARYLP